MRSRSVARVALASMVLVRAIMASPSPAGATSPHRAGFFDRRGERVWLDAFEDVR